MFVMKKIFVILCLATSAIIFNSCSTSRYTVSERPSIPYYQRPLSPGPGYVWINGDWYWSGGRYVYHNGYWMYPRPHRVWVTGRWVPYRNGYYWRRGYWR